MQPKSRPQVYYSQNFLYLQDKNKTFQSYHWSRFIGKFIHATHQYSACVCVHVRVEEQKNLDFCHHTNTLNLSNISSYISMLLPTCMSEDMAFENTRNLLRFQCKHSDFTSTPYHKISKQQNHIVNHIYFNSLLSSSFCFNHFIFLLSTPSIPQQAYQTS